MLRDMATTIGDPFVFVADAVAVNTANSNFAGTSFKIIDASCVIWYQDVGTHVWVNIGECIPEVFTLTGKNQNGRTWLR